MSQKSGPGWVRGTGRRDCPVGYPIKGNEPSNLYYEPGDPGYPQVIPEMCFEDVATAQKVGFSHVAIGTAAAAAAGAAAVGTAAAAAAGFVRQTGGGRTCPDGYPIKGNEPSNVFYRPEDQGYAQVVPEVCFRDVAEAERAGFSRVDLGATKRTEPVAAPRKEAAAAAAGAAAGVAAAKAANGEPVKAAPVVKTVDTGRVAAPPPPPPPPPPPAPVAESSGGGWMKWLLPLLALAVLAALIWYFTKGDDNKDTTPTPEPTVAATLAPTTGAGAAVGTVETGAVSTEGTVETAASTGVAGASASVEAAAANTQGTVEAAVAGAAGTVEAVSTSAAGTAEAAVSQAAGTVEAAQTSEAATIEAAAATVEAAVSGSPAASAVASPVASPSAGAIVLEAKDIAFEPTELTIKAANEPVTIKMENTGAAMHNFTIDSLNISVDVQPGETVDIVIPAGTAPGTYDFYCNVPGHKEAGMVGKLTVE